MENVADRLIWLDLEMSGLEPERHTILEIGTIVTDSQLNIEAEGPSLAIAHTDAVLAAMDPWCIEQHGKSGLTERCRKSHLTMGQAEEQILAFLRPYCKEKTSPLCGNSIGQDRRFLAKYMPKLNDFFHYRNIDVSTLKELVQRWYPAALHAPQKKKTHHVLEDIRESIEELRYYRKTIFK
jgi:oligoribonuclease